MSESIQKRFGRVIREARAGAGWSQEQLAEAAELNRSYLGEIERGDVTASLVTITKLASAFRKTPAELFSRLENSSPS